MNRKGLIVMALIVTSWVLVGYAFATISRAHILGQVVAERQTSDALRQEFDRLREKSRKIDHMCAVFEPFAELVIQGKIEFEDEDQWCAELIQMSDKRRA